MNTEILIASDHAGFELKNKLIQKMTPIKFKDMGTFDSSSVDYPDYADKVAAQINKFPQTKGVLICGSGQGMCMTANKYPNVRAALVYNEEIARLSREHNDANIICLGARFMVADLAEKCISIFLETSFGGGRHQVRVDKMQKGARS